MHRPANVSLLDQVAKRPRWMPSQVVAKRDTTAASTRQIVVDKTGLAAGSIIDTATGNIAVPLGVTVTRINNITRNGAVFTNVGQFAASGSNLLVYPSLIVQPAAGATDTYVVTLDNSGGGMTSVTINVQRGSVKIVSVAVAAVDTTPDAFDITNMTNQALSTVVTTNAVALSGINQSVTASTTVGTIVKNGTDTGLTSTTVNNGDTVAVKLTTSGTNSTAVNGTVTIGGVSDNFSVTTLATGITVATVSQGGLTWTKNNATATGNWQQWGAANTTCTTQTINNQVGWRLPTKDELVALYNSGAISGQGWSLDNTWSSTPVAATHYFVHLNTGSVSTDSDARYMYVTCVK